MATFLVLCCYIATIDDAASRKDIIDSLTDMARSQVAKHRQTAGKVIE